MSVKSKVSVIVPVYNVSRFVEKCVVSLFEQTLDSIQIIIVDDCSPDDSITIINRVLERYPDRKQNFLLIRHDHNKGLAAARNTGLSYADGDYVYHLDSDDWLEKSALEMMYEAAESKDADMVYSDFYLSFDENERYMSNPDFRTGLEYMKSGFLSGSAKYNVWNKLVKRSVYTDSGILFPEGHNMGEDMTMILLSSCSRNVVHVPVGLYHYVKLNASAYSNNISIRNLEDIRFNVQRVVEYLTDKYGTQLERELAFFKLSIKLPFLITDDADQHRIWKEWYPEANKYASGNRNTSLRIRILQVLASKGCFLPASLYYKLVFRFIYGVIYK